MPKKDTAVPGVEPAQQIFDAFKKASDAVERAFAPSRLMNAAIQDKLDECAGLIERLDNDTIFDIRAAADTLAYRLRKEQMRRATAEMADTDDMDDTGQGDAA